MKSSKESSIYGLVAGGDLKEALKSAEFVQLSETIAESFLKKKDAFTAIKLAVKAIVGGK